MGAEYPMIRVKIQSVEKFANSLLHKEDWRFYICALERLSQILCQPQVIQYMSLPAPDTPGMALLTYIFRSLKEMRNYRIINSALRTLRILCQHIHASSLERNLEIIVLALCSYLGCNYDGTIRLEAAETLKMLMRRFKPQTVVEYLFTEQCFGSKNSKMRENSLQCLMYALLSFPSNDFTLNEIADTLLKGGVKEPKRRVRQALLDTLSVLGQFLPRSQFKIECADEEAAMFKRALRARLTRRQLPLISSDGLILYAFQISPVTAFGTDVEWILSGHGSLSDNYNKSKTRDEDVSPTTHMQQNWNTHEGKGMSIYCKQLAQDEHFQHPLSRRGAASEETLSANPELHTWEKRSGYERYSADWTDSRYSYFGPLHTRFPSNLSDTSSYASSYTSEQNLPSLNTNYETAITRPVSEDKLDRLGWSPKTKHPSKLSTMRLEPTIQQLPIHYSYSNASASLPILNDKKSKPYLSDYYQEDKLRGNRLHMENANNWSKNKEKQHLNSDDTPKFDPPHLTNGRGEESELKSNIEQEILISKNALPEKTITSDSKGGADEDKKAATEKSELAEENEDPDDKLTELATECKNKHPLVEESNRTKSTLTNDCYKEKSKKFLERKAGVKLKRSLTKEIKMPQSTFCVDTAQLPPFENCREGVIKTILQFESKEWETVIEALQGVIRLTRHHSKYLSPCLHSFVIAVSKEIRSLRSQVARAACLSAESIFKHMKDISNQDIEELSNALFLRTADTNKFLREDSNKALDAMIDNVKFSKCVVILTQKVANHPNALIRASTARLLHKLILRYGIAKVLTLPKDKREAVLNTAVKFLVDGNLDTRTQGKNIFSLLVKDRKMITQLSELVPTSVMITVNKYLSRAIKK